MDNVTGANLVFEKEIFVAADKLRAIWMRLNIKTLFRADIFKIYIRFL